ncbi:MAG: hypothetical protein NTY15_11535 [Planctomycetota bacterium]|nr:hypothetical protein [Planctomycetota bacterium]
MKFVPKHLLIAATAACFASALSAQPSCAGQWLDSWFGVPQPAYPVGTPVPVNGQVAAYSPGAYGQAAYVPPAYSNLKAPQVAGYGSYVSPPTYNAPSIAPGFPQTVAGQLPTAAYDTQWARTPVTYYRPVTAFDPRYGTTVTSLQPCTSYQYQAQRQPVIAPRPLLGDYGSQANRWPSITGPGYNPTGLATTAMYGPAVAPVQSIPSTGMPVYPSSALSPTGVGVSSGMPASSLPLKTMQYNPVVSGQPYVAQPYSSQQAAYYNGQNFSGQVIGNPAYSSGVSALPYNAAANQPIGSGVMPTAAWVPSAAAQPNGFYSPQSTAPSYPNQQTPPSIPGATVTAVGTPVYTAVPNPTSGTFGLSQPVNPGSGYSSGASYNPVITPYSTPYNPAGTPPVLPNGQIMPPGTNSTDPEANRRPALPSVSQASAPPANNALNGNPASKPIESSFKAQDNSVVAAESTNKDSMNKDSTAQWKSSELFAKPRETMAADAGATRASVAAPEIPETLPPRVNYGMKPLSAPDDFDTKPRWNPTLLDPDDRTAMERAGQLTPESTKLVGRIRTLEDRDYAVTAVAIESKQLGRSNIQLASGVETKLPVTSTKTSADDQSVGFRPVATLK